MDAEHLLTWQEKMIVFDKEQKSLQNELEGLVKWMNEIEKMNEQQLKDYLQNRPDNLKTITTQKTTPNKRVQRARKSKISGIMSTVWKYHNENVEDDSNSIEGNA
ncbi:uncharacterized protein LOC130788313 [Actinidia eriantha]|uniref:uncharacterized protein LOC130788313 n=1 Tax=Actinidia eriantha TaxID=165200 RepID=UPI00258CA4C0|nr:uncharacterized protein LOC130788313 [Actinidia eriantha]